MIFKLTKCNTFKKLIQNIKNIIIEIDLILDVDGLKIININNDNDIYIDFFISRNYFDEYRIKSKVIISIQIYELYKCLKTCRERDIICLNKIKDSYFELIISNKTKISKFEIKCQHIENYNEKLFHCLLNNKFKTNIESFLSVLQSLVTFTDIVSISIENNKLKFIGADDNIEQESIILLEKNVVNNVLVGSTRFNLLKLINLIKFGIILNNSEISLEYNKPIQLLFGNENNIYMNIFLSPIN